MQLAYIICCYVKQTVGKLFGCQEQPLLEKYAWNLNISLVESQKGVIFIQRCSVENQKGAIVIDFVQRSRPFGFQQLSTNDILVNLSIAHFDAIWGWRHAKS